MAYNKINPQLEEVVEGDFRLQLGSDFALEEDKSFVFETSSPIRWVSKCSGVSISAQASGYKLHNLWSWSYDGIEWSDWLQLNVEVEFKPLETLWVRVRTIPVKSSEDAVEIPIVNNYTFSLTREVFRQDSLLSELTNKEDCIILSPQDNWKVFRLEGFKADIGNLSDAEIKFRTSFNSRRTWSDWIHLTPDALAEVEVEPLRFMNIEYSICKKGENTAPINVYDLVLLGDVQNVTQDYKTGNMMGLRQDCSNQYLGLEEMQAEASLGKAQCIPGTVFDGSEFVNEDGTLKGIGTFWRPYTADKPLGLYNQLSKQTTEIFGWQVDYYKTLPNKGGTDVVLHEYQLKDVIAKCPIKIMVPDNNFPEKTIQFNQFDLELFDTFEIHIPRAEFKMNFGEESRPDKFDFLFICETNMLYQVEHSIANKDFLNSSIYYKVVLKKAQKNANVRIIEEDIEDEVKKLTDNNSLDALFGEDVKQEMDKVAELPEQTAKHIDEIRKEVNPSVRIRDFNLILGSNIIAKSFYDLENMQIGEQALVFEQKDLESSSASVRTFSFWFNLRKNTRSTILDNFNQTENGFGGYKIRIEKNRLEMDWGNQLIETTYDLSTNVWYGIHVEVDQAKKKYEMNFFRRGSEKNPDTTKILLLAARDSGDIENQSWKFTEDSSIVVDAGSYFATNFRVLSRKVPAEEIQSYMQQYWLKDRTDVILLDNAHEKYAYEDFTYRKND